MSDPEAPETRDLSDQLVSSGRCDDFLLALIDFGTAVCTASNPNRDSCPFEETCEYADKQSNDE